MKLIFDFDDTIFDTKRFKKERLFKCLEKYGITPENFEKSYLEHRKKYSNYDIDIHFQELVKDFGVNVNIKQVIIEITTNIQKFVFPDVKNIFAEQGKENIFIITQGSTAYQKLKTENSKIREDVEEIIVVSGSKLEEINALCEKFRSEMILFFDDKYEHLILENQPKNLICIFVGDVNSLSESQKKELNDRNISMCQRSGLDQKISKLTKENAIKNDQPKMG